MIGGLLKVLVEPMSIYERTINIDNVYHQSNDTTYYQII